MIRAIVVAALLAATPAFATDKGGPKGPSAPSVSAPSKPSAPAAAAAGPKKGKDVGVRSNDACEAKASVGNLCPQGFVAE